MSSYSSGMDSDLPVNEVVLSRGEAGLGFNIRGGLDIPFIPGDFGIFVTKIRENGAAFTDGRIKEGDRILEVNGTSLERVTHNEAVELFVKAGETVRLKVQHGAQKEIVDKLAQKREIEARNEKSRGSSSSLLVFSGVVAAVAIAFFVYRKYAR